MAYGAREFDNDTSDALDLVYCGRSCVKYGVVKQELAVSNGKL